MLETKGDAAIEMLSSVASSVTVSRDVSSISRQIGTGTSVGFCVGLPPVW